MGSFSNDKKRAVAERYYVEHGMSQKAIAEALEITEKTVSIWARKYDWSGLRTQFLSAPHRIKTATLELTEELLKIDTTPSRMKEIQQKADALAKISRSLSRIDKEVSVQMVISVFKEFDAYVAQQDSELAVSFLEMHKSFIRHKIAQQ